MSKRKQQTQTRPLYPLAEQPYACESFGCMLLTYHVCVDCGLPYCVDHEDQHLPVCVLKQGMVTPATLPTPPPVPEDVPELTDRPQHKRTRKPKPPKPPRGAERYFGEIVLYGGVYMTRGEVIADLEAQGGTPRMVDRYLFGLDRHMERLRAQWKADNNAEQGKDAESEAAI